MEPQHQRPARNSRTRRNVIANVEARNICIIATTIWTMVFLAASQSCASLIVNISTGVDRTTGAQLTNNTSDPNWIVGPNSDSNTGLNLNARNSPLPGTYGGASSASRFDTIASGSGPEGMNVSGTNYDFRTTVDITGFDPSTAAIQITRFEVDDQLAGISVNGITAFTPGNGFSQGIDKFYTSIPANVGLGDFVSGVNTIDFQLVNTVIPSPVSLRIEGTVTATPEPALSLATVGSGMVLLLRRRMRCA